MGEEITEQTAGKGKAMGAAGAAGRLSPSEYEEDLVNLLCTLCSRIRTYPELLLIFFQDKNWASHHTPSIGSDDLSNSDEEEEEGGELGGAVLVEEAPSTPPEDGGQEEGPEDASDADSAATPTKQTVLLAQAFARSNAPSPSSSAPRSIRSAPPPIPKPHYEFLIFTYLMRFIHREGDIGEYGRAGLLFLLDIAMSAHEIKSQSKPISHDPLSDIAIALAEYILEGDFAEVLGAGLGAVYSLLPYKLELRKEDGGSDAPSQGGGMVLGVATTGTMDEEKRRIELEEDRVRKLGADVSSSAEFKARLDHFLKLLQYVQDVLKRLEVSTIAEATVQANEGIPGSDDGSESPALVGRAIALSILDSIRSIFLQNVLYPSILECSEADGSAVAVLSYINILLCTLRHGPLTHVLLDFLTSEDETSGKASHVPQTPAIRRSMAKKKALRRRSSAMVLLSLEAPQTTSDAPEYFNSLGRFTLKDLLVTNLGADKHEGIAPLQTGVGVLTLLRTLTSQYCTETVDTLLTVGRDPAPHPLPQTFDDLWEEEDVSDDEEEFVYTGVDASPQTTPQPRRKLKSFRHMDILLQPDTTISTQIMEQKMYLNLVQKIDGGESAGVFSTKYDHYLGDAIESIRCHQCSSGLGRGPSIKTRSKTRHRLLPTDPLISALLQSLRAFFAHSPEYNLALTGVIAEISSCPERSLAGWLTLAPKEETSNAWNIQGLSFEPQIQDNESDGEQSDDALVDARLRAENPALGFDYRLKEQAAMPVLYTVFSGLVAQLDRYRAMVDDLDSLLSERRKGLLFSENLSDALNLTLDVDQQFDPSKLASTPTTTPKKPSSQPATPPSTVTPKPKSKGGMSFMPSFLTTKKKSGSTPGEQSSTTAKKRTSGEIPASPFVPHYQRTVAVEVEAFAAPPPSEGPWSPEARKPKRGFGSFSLDNAGGFGTEADVFSAPDPRMNSIREEGSGDESDNEREGTGKTITLSQLLDNVVLLEEAIKELTAIIQARVSLGIDEVRYI
ncbi:hypothetical protein FRC01_009717 [Tulasnella sp. 417]|nr:hypothetical protein FRC01_009717 [Tulasnella sp. 417]